MGQAKWRLWPAIAVAKSQPMPLTSACWQPTHYGRPAPSPGVEDAASVRDHLPGVGVHVLCDPYRRARSSAIPFRGDAVSAGGTRPLWLDGRAGRAFTDRAPVAFGVLAGRPDLRPRLRTVVLGRAACAFGHRVRHDGHDSGVHGTVGDRYPANAAAHRPAGFGAPGRAWRSSGADESLAEARWRADRHAGRRGTNRRVNQLVSGVSSDFTALPAI